ncbi:MAG: hypothetical protein U9N85_12390 [Bacteroidota bacterium]|nr:hypothetical protein [Bacteroidota bacterium]
MENELCPKTENCPLFQGEMLASQKAQEIYKKLYCENGKEGWMSCKRYLVSLKEVEPPQDLMPNDSRSVEEILEAL